MKCKKTWFLIHCWFKHLSRFYINCLNLNSIRSELILKQVIHYLFKTKLKQGYKQNERKSDILHFDNKYQQTNRQTQFESSLQSDFFHIFMQMQMQFVILFIWYFFCVPPEELFTFSILTLFVFDWISGKWKGLKRLLSEISIFWFDSFIALCHHFYFTKIQCWDSYCDEIEQLTVFFIYSILQTQL